MIKNHLKIILRQLLRNKMYVGINVLGLGIALACGIIAFLNYQFDKEFRGLLRKVCQHFSEQSRVILAEANEILAIFTSIGKKLKL